MKAFLTALLICVCAPSWAWAANPLSPAERRVCSSLNHCLKIIKDHPHDAFDYAVIAEEFQSFDTKGRKPLIRMIGKGGDSARHAADLVLQIGDTSMLPHLRKLRARATNETAPLIERTIKALESRLRSGREDRPEQPKKIVSQIETICPRGTRISYDARRREMPFFELDIAVPDEFGSYRPSARYNAPTQFLTRGWLRAAQPIPGGWLAAYPDGLIEFDNGTGAPRLRIKGNIISLQNRQPSGLSTEHWLFILNAKNQTYIADVGTKMTRLKTALPAPLAELRRGDDGAIYASSGKGQSVTLLPDGSTRPGCATDAS